MADRRKRERATWLARTRVERHGVASACMKKGKPRPHYLTYL
jgi:predicted Fe-S protein YdhL (DUF1289 family)